MARTPLLLINAETPGRDSVGPILVTRRLVYVRHEKLFAALIGILLGVVACCATTTFGQTTLEPTPTPAPSGSGQQQPGQPATAVSQPSFSSWEEIGTKRLAVGEVEILRLPAPAPPCPTGAPGRIDLFGAVSRAIQCNPKLKAYQAEVMQARAARTVAFSPFYPKIANSANLIGTTGPFFALGQISPDLQNRSSGFVLNELTIEWILWDFGRRLGTYRQYDLQYQISRFQCRRAEQTVAFFVSQSYFQLLEAYAEIRVADDTIRRSNEYLRVSNNLYVAGETDREAVLSAQYQLTQAQQLMVSSQADKRIKAGNLNTQIGLPVLTPVCAIDCREVPKMDIPVVACVDLGHRQRFEVKAAVDYIAKACEQKRVARADFKPEIYTNGGYTTLGGDLTSDFYSGAVTFDWELFSGGKRVGVLREAQGAICYARAQHREICNRIGDEINSAFQTLISARHNLVLSRSAVKLADERYRIVLDKFSVGKANPTAVLEAHTELTRAEQSENRAFYNLLIAFAQLEYAVGGPLAP